MLLNGFINLDKPLNMSSARAVDAVKRLLPRGTKIGHAGTLDPLASGVLVLAVGKATKLIQHVQDAPKEYVFTATWGAERSTDDMEGEITITSDKRPTLAEIEAILPKFTGEIMQAPPAFSAIKIDGKRAYALARAGQAPEMKERMVRVDQLSVIPAEAGIYSRMDSHLRGSDETTFRVVCGKGTYIRSLARDMGRELGVYAYVSMLRRTRVGIFDENSAISLENLEKLVHKGDLGFLREPQAVLDDILASA